MSNDQDSELQQSLQEAPPGAPTASDFAAQQAQQQANADRQVAAAINPNGPGQPQQFDSGLARPPAFDATRAPGVPTAPSSGSEVATPIGADQSNPGSFAQKFFTAMSALSAGNHGLTPPAAFAAAGIQAMAPPKPSGWSSALSNADASQPTTPAPAGPSRAQQIGNNIGDTIGDAAAATNDNGAGGAFGGLARTLAAGTNRRREELRDRITIATANANMLHEQFLIHNLGENAIEKGVVSGNSAYNAVMSAEVPGTPLAQGKTSDELKDMVSKGQIDPSKDFVFLTARTPDGKDSNGLPLFRSTYSVVRPGGDVQLTEDQAKYLSDNTSNKFTKDTPPINPAIFNQLWQQAQGHEAAEVSRKYALAQLGEKTADIKTNQDARTLLSDPKYISTLAGTQSSPTDPFGPIKAFNALSGNQAWMDAHPNFRESFNKAFGGKLAEMEEKFAKAQEKNDDATTDMIHDFTKNPDKISGHTPAVIAATEAIIRDTSKSAPEVAAATSLRAQALATQAFEKTLEGEKEISKEDIKTAAKKRADQLSNPNSLQGDAFVNSIQDAGRRNAIRAFGEGKIAVVPSALERTDKGQAYLNDLYAAYPDLDTGKAPAYMKMRSNFTTGKEAAALNSSNTVMRHLDGMLNSLDAGATAGYTGHALSGLNLNDAGRALDNTSQVLSNELDKFYAGGGQGAEAEKKEWRDKLNPYSVGMTNDKLKKNINTFAKLVGGKLEAYQAQWDDGVPSAHIAAPKSIADPKSMATYKRATGEDLQVHQYQPGFGPQNQQSVQNAESGNLAATPAKVASGLPANAPSSAVTPPPQFKGIASGAAPGPGGKMFWYKTLPDGTHKVLGPATELEGRQ